MATPDNEKRTPVFDWQAGDFAVDLQGKQLTATVDEAVKQIVLKALQTDRGFFLIYENLEDEELDDAYGSDVADIATRAELPEDVRLDEIKRAIKEALIYDDWITDVYDIVLTRRRDSKTITNEDGTVTEIATDELYADLTVNHIFGTTSLEGVNVFNA